MENNRDPYEYLSNERLEGESFEEYKQRRKIANLILKNYYKGRPKNVKKQGEESIEG